VQQVLELADLVAAIEPAGQVITLDADPVLILSES
jgi:hypothetical protein